MQPTIKELLDQRASDVRKKGATVRGLTASTANCRGVLPMAGLPLLAGPTLASQIHVQARSEPVVALTPSFAEGIADDEEIPDEWYGRLKVLFNSSAPRIQKKVYSVLRDGLSARLSCFHHRS